MKDVPVTDVMILDSNQDIVVKEDKENAVNESIA